MTRWWSLALGEWSLVAFVAGGGVGVLAASALGMDQVGTWAACLGAALLLGGAVQFAARGRADSRLPKVSLGATLLVGVPLLAAWWILAAFVGVPTSGFNAAYFVWFVGGVFLVRIGSRLVSAYVARNRIAADGSAGTTAAGS